MKSLQKLTVKKLKIDCWKLFSRYIRLRDCLATTGTLTDGKCFTCGREYPFRQLQAGHFVAGRHNGNLFSERGCHAQCALCNIYNHGNTLEYRRQVIRKYGIGADEELEKEAAVIRKFTVEELLALKESLQLRIKKLEVL